MEYWWRVEAIQPQKLAKVLEAARLFQSAGIGGTDVVPDIFYNLTLYHSAARRIEVLALCLLAVKGSDVIAPLSNFYFRSRLTLPDFFGHVENTEGLEPALVRDTLRGIENKLVLEKDERDLAVASYILADIAYGGETEPGNPELRELHQTMVRGMMEGARYKMHTKEKEELERRRK